MERRRQSFLSIAFGVSGVLNYAYILPIQKIKQKKI